jgi:hypothetical protein
MKQYKTELEINKNKVYLLAENMNKRHCKGY